MNYRGHSPTSPTHSPETALVLKMEAF